ncbi:DeoR/GlpR family DNA-binding transcription regulator [Notoacmeibacter sp. MSK16QG-6]|uniref:DeoR/GlpR family DNA-binding transcription regulator n=1 Tax=Notoacmeibacter sp. MSK16QG-6 TaxID=2957982 RepID=UPI00209FA76F|nr:DeoR/GlpR family DNA-binding transcription regulator [Notoacmeibacter sp. MSK16QG-6]MCP1200467.1 DeoR/GlpR family DNA-binding transcription regulator [Notoacmeibacter sp. MSK16QG-6]
MSVDETHEKTIERLMTADVPSDGRQARQLARRQLIAETVMTEGTMRIEELTERFGISLMTVHRDLDELASRGLLRKTRGIVSAAPTSLIESSDLYRSHRQPEEKKALAQAALEFIEPGQAIFIDDSTSALQLVEYLPERVPLTIITNSLRLMNAVKDIADLNLIALGGEYHGWANAFMGRATTSQISRLRADMVIFSMAAVTDDMIFHPSAEVVETKRAMIDASAKSVFLVDHTKFERRALYGLGALSEMDAVITDAGTSDTHLQRMRSNGINVIVARSDDTKTETAA